MLRKLTLALVAAASLSAMALAPTAASAKPWGGGWGGGFGGYHHHWGHGFGIGIHGGEVIIGDIGYRDHMVFTALGDAVNVASRLQDMTKTLGCEAIVSDEVRATAGLADDALPQQEVDIRGRAAPMRVRVVGDAKALAGLVEERDVAVAGADAV